jgi:uncharacterized protein (DUF1778 family)
MTTPPVSPADFQLLGARFPESSARLVRAAAIAQGRTVSDLIRETVVPAAREALAAASTAIGEGRGHG